MKTTLVFIFLPLLISSYNLDIAYVTDVNATEFSTCFGYSVGLYSQNSSTGFSSWMIISSPEFKIGSPTGKLYTVTDGFDGFSYTYTRPADLNRDGTPYAPAVNVITGAAMDVSEMIGTFLVCNPLENIEIHGTGNIKNETLAGVCYDGSIAHDMTESSHLSTYLQHNNPTTGFAVHYPRLQKFTPLRPVRDRTYLTDPIIGSPLHENVGAVHKINHGNWTILERYTERYLPLFGYAISSGIYFDTFELMVAGGAPGWNFVGQVAIMRYYPDSTTPFPIISKINGTELGEFFGASLTTGDLNNDGLDDLIVGAPHWKNDNGRVFIYLGNEEGFFKTVIVLKGSVDDAQYGYTLTSGDLDNDGFDDLIVSAPWEDSGAIYVYNGAVNLAVLDSTKPSQKLTSSSVRRFGFSLSRLIDVDDNGFRDVAVGADGTVQLFRSRPVVKTEITLSTMPTILLKNSRSFLVQFCVTVIPSLRYDGVLILSVDKDFKRVNETLYKFIASDFHYCKNKTFYLQNIGNYSEDIEIIAEWEFADTRRNCPKIGRRSGWSCPIKYKNKKPYNHERLSFDIGPQASIVTKWEFQGISNSTYIIGSNGLNLVLMIENDGQPAYSVSVIFYIPEGVFLKDLLPSCYEERGQQTLMVKCDIGDPLTKDMPKNITLNLAISSFPNTPLYETELNFIVEIKTRSRNKGHSKVTIPLKLETNFSIALSGKAHKNVSYFRFNNKPSIFAFEHNYQISQFGVTPISKVYLKVLVPCKLGCLKFLTIEQNPRFLLSDRFYDCTLKSRRIRRKTRISPSDVNANQLQCENIRSQHYFHRNTQKSEVINLNCSTPNVICEQVECEISFLDTAYDFGRLPIQLNMEISELIGHTKEQELTIHLTTEASVHVPNKKIPFDIPGTGIPFPVTTVFHISPNPLYAYSIFNTIFKEFKVLKEEINIQLILGSILVGLLLLGLLVIILRHMGFFERKKKEAMKSEELEMIPNNVTPNDAQVSE